MGYQKELEFIESYYDPESWDVVRITDGSRNFYVPYWRGRNLRQVVQEFKKAFIGRYPDYLLTHIPLRKVVAVNIKRGNKLFFYVRALSIELRHESFSAQREGWENEL